MKGRLLVVTGISGSGRSTCLRALEDLGWFCVDNLPAQLLASLHDAMLDRAEPQPMAVGIDVRAGAFLDDIDAALATLSAAGVKVELLFVDCADDVTPGSWPEEGLWAEERRHDTSGWCDM